MLRTLIRLFKSFSRVERSLFIGAAVIFITAFAFNTAKAIYHNTTLTPAVGGQYTEGLIGQPIMLNPLFGGSGDADRDLMELLFTDLITLSEKYEVSEDGKTWTIDLKENLKWSDEEPLNADDVIFTLGTIQAPETNSPLASSWQGVSIERVSERSVRITTKTPYAFFLDNLKNFKIAPRHIFQSIPPQNLRLSNYNLEPVSSGPYAFVRYEKEKDGFITKYTFTSNPFYAGGHALIPSFNIAFFKNYKDAIIAFNQKLIDGLGGFDPANVDDLKLTHRLFEINVPRYYAVFLNQSANTALKETAVRTALDLATPKQEIIQTVFGDRALLVNGPILPYITGYDASIYNSDAPPVSAITLLEDAGWKPGADGIREKLVGKTTQRLEFEMAVPNIEFLTATAAKIQEAWAPFGIKLNLNTLTPAELNGTLIKTRNYQMVLFGNILRGNPDLFSFWHSSQRFSPGLNLSLYQNATIDKLLESTRKEFDEAKRAESLSEIQSQIYKDRPAIFLFSPTYLYASTKDLGGFEENFITTTSHRFSNVAKWYLETARVFK
jgi:peptide/nickel transport system substrate-binding protein